VGWGLGSHGMVGGLAKGGVGLENETIAFNVRLLAITGETLGAESWSCADGMARAGVDLAFVAHGAQIGLGGSRATTAVELRGSHGVPGIAVNAQGSTGRALGHAVGSAALQMGELKGRILVALGDHHLAPAGLGGGAGTLASGTLGVAALRQRGVFLLELLVSRHFAQDLLGTGFGGGNAGLDGGALTHRHGTDGMRAADNLLASLDFTLGNHDYENRREIRTG